MRLQIDVIVRRGAIAESHHSFRAAVCDTAGRSVAGTDGSGTVTTFRSAAKPFQLLPLIERGHADRLGLSDEDLAIMVGSHTGSPYHVALVKRLLMALGLGDAHLVCGYHDPLDPESQAFLTAHPESRSRIYNNCSGNHAGMLALARSEGWPVEGYERHDHPLQQLMHRTVAEACGMDPAAVEIAVDGCGVSAFALPLSAMARGYAALAAAGPQGGPRERALDRIRRAMQRFPQAIGGRGRLSTALIEASGGRWIAKGGAEGLECVGLPARGLGVAVKCVDGQSRGLGPAVVALMDRLGEIEPSFSDRLGELRRPPITNHAGLEVGFLEASVQTLPASDPVSAAVRDA